jgi:serine/threonine protein kinase
LQRFNSKKEKERVQDDSDSYDVEVALKVVAGKQHLVQALREVRTLEELKGHRNIVRLYDAQVDHVKASCVMEMQLARGGDLLGRIGHGSLGEVHAAGVAYQVFSGVAFAHRKGICHRDIKLESMEENKKRNRKKKKKLTKHVLSFFRKIDCLFLSDDHVDVVVCDWGLSAEFESNTPLTQDCGSLHYAAPEILANRPYYGPLVDAWSLGVLLYALVTAHFPFIGNTCKARLLAILSANGRPRLPRALSPELCDLLVRLFSIDPRQRLTAANAVKHAWFRKYCPPAIRRRTTIMPRAEASPSSPSTMAPTRGGISPPSRGNGHQAMAHRRIFRSRRPRSITF